MHADEINHFLVVLSIRSGAVEVKAFGSDYTAALAEYEALEEATNDDPDKDVVMIGADSLETVKRTHASYFAGEKTESDFDAFLEEGLSAVNQRA
jgi:hypothetical protein